MVEPDFMSIVAFESQWCCYKPYNFEPMTKAGRRPGANRIEAHRNIHWVNLIKGILVKWH